MKKLIMIALSLSVLGLYAVGVRGAGLVIEHRGILIELDALNPVTWDETGFAIEPVTETMHAFYTARYPKSTLTQTERGFIVFDAQGVIVRITEETETITIPISGGVLSLPSNHPALTVFQNGDHVTLPESIVLQHPFVFESSNGRRIVADGINTARLPHSLIVYDSRYGTHTETLRNGSEVALVYDETAQHFRVETFRSFGAGPDGGLPIPSNGYVLSAGLERRFELFEDVLWTLKEEVHVMDLTLLEGETYTHGLDATDPTLESNPGGIDANAFRGTDQMIRYTTNWTGGQDGGTGTNVHGVEAAVDEQGMVVEVATHVIIPTNGFVLSGHGVSAQFIRDHVSIGSHITIEDNQVTVRNDPIRIALAEQGHTLAAIEALYKSMKVGLYDVNLTTANQLLVTARNRYKTMVEALEIFDNTSDEAVQLKQAEHIRQMAPLVENELLHARYALMPSLAVEARGIWHRPTERSLQAIVQNMDLWVSLGLNSVYVETLWSGYVNHPSDMIERHPDLEGAFYGQYGDDYLAAFIAEAHARGIEVHAWNEIFFTGSLARPLSNILRDNPSWRMVNHDGGLIQNNMIFSDPANLEWRAFLVEYHRELFANYAFDGMQFDYIRYPFLREHTDPNSLPESGFTEAAITRFKEETGVTGDVRERVMYEPDIKAQFDAFRRQQVTDTLIAIRSALIEDHPELVFSIAIAPDRIQARNQYFQDWPAWMEAGYIDHIAPMIYHYDVNHVGRHMETIQSIIGNKAFQYAGIAPVYFGHTVLNNQEQMVEANQRGAFGSIMFASHNIDGHDAFQTALRLSTGRKKAVLPHAPLSQVLEAALAEQHHKIDTLYSPNDAVHEAFLPTLQSLLGDTLNISLEHAGDYAKLYEALQVIHAYRHQAFTGAAVERFDEDISRLMRIVDIHISRDLIIRGFWNPENDPHRPDPSTLSFPASEPHIPEASGMHWAFAVSTLVLGLVTLGGLVVLRRRLKPGIS